MPVNRSRIPNAFFKSSGAIFVPMRLNAAAEIVPPIIAGARRVKLMQPCFLRNRLLMMAVGRKNRRLMFLASGWEIPTISVNQSVSRLPPPTPIPARNPKTVPISAQNPNVSSIYSGCLPRVSLRPESDAAIMWESFSRTGRQECRRRCCHKGMGMRFARIFL